VNEPSSTAGVPAFPRYFRIFGRWLSAYKAGLCIGIYAGVLTSAAVADRSGISPFAMGMGGLACAIAGLFGARIYHLVVFAKDYASRGWAGAWDSRRGGWSVFGALPPLALVSLLASRFVGVPLATFWDPMMVGVVVGAIPVRLGCLFNGCCGGRESTSAISLCLHDVGGVRKRRIPVQLLEIGWWILCGAALYHSSSWQLAPGVRALGVLAWYGVGRFWLETLRESPDRVLGGLRVNQVVAAALAIVAGGAMLLLG
jgi:prolipoprotein diacylglyceryltransferase